MPKGISETAFASQVEDLLRLFGWRWTHFRPAWSSKGYRTPIKGHKGFPDYCAVRPPRLIFAELKDQYSKPSSEQDEWLNDLRECVRQITAVERINPGEVISVNHLTLMTTFEVYLFRPNDIERVIEILR